MLAAIIMRIIPDWKDKELHKNELVQLNQQLKEVQDKNAMIDTLANRYKSKLEDVEVLTEYIPLKAGEEDIINNLISYANYQIGEDAISITNISVGDGSDLTLTSKTNLPPDPEKKLQEFADAMSKERSDSKEKKSVAGDPLAEMEKVVEFGEVPSKPNQLAVTISLETSYNGMKEFFKKIDSLKRFNNVSSFRVASDDEEKIKVDAILVFNYLKRYNPETVNDSFLANSFDDEIVEKVKKRAIANTLKIEIKPPVGRVNPFLP
jgi:hypothetical protein